MLHEPDTSVFEVMSLILIEKGYTIRPFPYTNPTLTREILDFRPDLIIIDFFQDHSLPTKIASLVRSVLPSTGLILSSCNFDIDKIYINMGFDYYLSKPFDIDQFAKLVNIYSQKAKLPKHKIDKSVDQ